MLGVELAVPVYFGVVEFEDTAGLAYLNVQIIRTPEDFVGKSSELVLRANVVDLVDDGLDVRVLVKEDLGDDVFVGQVLISDIEMGCLVSSDSASFWTMKNIPTCPTVLKPLGISSWSSSGRIDFMTSTSSC